MNILYVAATEIEIAPFLQAKPHADFLITGLGIPFTVYHLTKRLQQIDYDLVIQAGISGSFSSAVQPGDTVFVSKDNLADIGFSEKNTFSTIFEKGFVSENEFPFSNGWLENREPLMDLFPLMKVNGITVNTVTDNVQQVEIFSRKFKAEVETMEGAAFHYTCLNEKIRFMQLRSISNFVGERDKTKWCMEEAIQSLNGWLLKITDDLTKQGQ